MKCLICFGVFVIAGPLAIAQTDAQQTQDANLKAYVGMMRQDLKKDKVAILTELLAFGPDEASKFWAVYNEYDKALTKLGDERIAFIRLYAENYRGLSNDMATKLAMGLINVEAKRVDLRKQYFQRISLALSAKDAARWLQVETQIEKVIDLQILSNLPIVE
jgi:hypothetical protein